MKSLLATCLVLFVYFLSKRCLSASDECAGKPTEHDCFNAGGNCYWCLDPTKEWAASCESHEPTGGVCYNTPFADRTEMWNWIRDNVAHAWTGDLSENWKWAMRMCNVSSYLKDAVVNTSLRDGMYCPFRENPCQDFDMDDPNLDSTGCQILISRLDAEAACAASMEFGGFPCQNCLEANEKCQYADSQSLSAVCSTVTMTFLNPNNSIIDIEKCPGCSVAEIYGNCTPDTCAWIAFGNTTPLVCDLESKIDEGGQLDHQITLEQAEIDDILERGGMGAFEVAYNKGLDLAGQYSACVDPRVIVGKMKDLPDFTTGYNPLNQTCVKYSGNVPGLVTDLDQAKLEATCTPMNDCESCSAQPDCGWVSDTGVCTSLLNLKTVISAAATDGTGTCCSLKSMGTYTNCSENAYCGWCSMEQQDPTCKFLRDMPGSTCLSEDDVRFMRVQEDSAVSPFRASNWAKNANAGIAMEMRSCLDPSLHVLGETTTMKGAFCSAGCVQPGTGSAYNYCVTTLEEVQLEADCRAWSTCAECTNAGNCNWDGTAGICSYKIKGTSNECFPCDSQTSYEACSGSGTHCSWCVDPENSTQMICMEPVRAQNTQAKCLNADQADYIITNGFNAAFEWLYPDFQRKYLGIKSCLDYRTLLDSQATSDGPAVAAYNPSTRNCGAAIAGETLDELSKVADESSCAVYSGTRCFKCLGVPGCKWDATSLTCSIVRGSETCDECESALSFGACESPCLWKYGSGEFFCSSQTEYSNAVEVPSEIVDQIKSGELSTFDWLQNIEASPIKRGYFCLKNSAILGSTQGSSGLDVYRYCPLEVNECQRKPEVGDPAYFDYSCVETIRGLSLEEECSSLGCPECAESMLCNYNRSLFSGCHGVETVPSPVSNADECGSCDYSNCSACSWAEGCCWNPQEQSCFHSNEPACMIPRDNCKDFDDAGDGTELTTNPEDGAERMSVSMSITAGVIILTGVGIISRNNNNNW